MSRGLSFVPIDMRPSGVENHWDLSRVKVRSQFNLKYMWFAEQAKKKFGTPKQAEAFTVIFQPHHAPIANFLDRMDKRLSEDIKEASREPLHDNLTAYERQALAESREDRSIVIQPADKGRMVVAIDRDR